MTGLLLDTHVLLWCWSDDPALSRKARAAISNSKAAVFVSAASAWEISTKARLGRLTAYGDIAWRFNKLVAAASMTHLPVTHLHALRAGSYALAHRDPFDRMLAAQAELESLLLVTSDSAFAEFPVTVLW